MCVYLWPPTPHPTLPFPRCKHSISNSMWLSPLSLMFSLSSHQVMSARWFTRAGGSKSSSHPYLCLSLQLWPPSLLQIGFTDRRNAEVRGCDPVWFQLSLFNFFSHFSFADLDPTADEFPSIRPSNLPHSCECPPSPSPSLHLAICKSRASSFFTLFSLFHLFHLLPTSFIQVCMRVSVSLCLCVCTCVCVCVIVCITVRWGRGRSGTSGGGSCCRGGGSSPCSGPDPDRGLDRRIPDPTGSASPGWSGSPCGPPRGLRRSSRGPRSRPSPSERRPPTARWSRGPGRLRAPCRGSRTSCCWTGPLVREKEDAGKAHVSSNWCFTRWQLQRAIRGWHFEIIGSWNQQTAAAAAWRGSPQGSTSASAAHSPMFKRLH